MTKGIISKEPDPEIVYADIFNHPRHVSDHHPQMSLYNRAAQFAPFAALSGYDEMIDEEARLVDNRIELSDEETAHLSQKLSRIADAIADGTKPELSITYFIADPLKAGGRYETVTETIRKVDTVEQVIILNRKVGKAGSYETIRIADKTSWRSMAILWMIWTDTEAKRLFSVESDRGVHPPCSLRTPL